MGTHDGHERLLESRYIKLGDCAGFRRLRPLRVFNLEFFLKNVENGHFLNGRALGNARAARHPLTRTLFASLIDSLHASVCRMSIGRRRAELRAREATPADLILTFSTISRQNFPVLRQWEKARFSSACHAPPRARSDPN